MTRLLKYAIILVIIYLGVTAFFANRLDNEYFSVVLSDGWSMSQDTKQNGNYLSGSFVNKNTQTEIEYHVGPTVGFESDLSKLFSPIMQIGSALFNSDLKMGDTQQGKGFSFVKYTKANISGLILYAQNNYATLAIDISGPNGFTDGVAFVNNFFHKDKTLFPPFEDPEIPTSGLNLHLIQHNIKTVFHTYINPKEIQAKFAD